MTIASVILLIVIVCVHFVWSKRKQYALSLKMASPKGLPIIGILPKIYDTRRFLFRDKLELLQQGYGTVSNIAADDIGTNILAGEQLFQLVFYGVVADNNLVRIFSTAYTNAIFNWAFKISFSDFSCPIIDVLYALEEFIAECKSKTLFLWIGPIANVYTADPEIASVILNSSDCINKSAIYDSITEMIGGGVLTSRAPKWNAHRKLLNPFFSPKVLLGFLPVFNRFAKEMCEKLDAQVGCEEVDLNKLLFNLGLKSSLETSMDTVFDSNKNELFLENFERICDAIMQLRFSIILRQSSLYKLMKEVQTNEISFLRKLIEGKVNESKHQQAHNKSTHLDRTDTKKNSNNNIYTFIEKAIKLHQNNDFTVDDVFENTILMALAASETIATTMFFALIFLAMHPQYQEKLFEEICSVFPDKDFEVHSEDLKNLVYLEMCINETICDSHPEYRSEDIWGTDSKSFNPDHFLPINLEGKHKYSFMPFSKGQRNCIGWRYAEMAMKTVLVHILRRYLLTTTFKFEDIRYVNNIVLRYDKIAYVKIEGRDL